MPRPKNQTARRELLVDAAGRAIAERGLSNLRVKDIAAEAGLSAASVLYYYPELADLLFEVHRALVDRFYRRRLEAIEAVPDPPQRLVRAIDCGIATTRDDETFRLLYELHDLANRSTLHSTLMTTLYDREVALYVTILEAGTAAGYFTLREPVWTVAKTMIVLEDGFGLHILSNNSAIDPGEARTLMLSYASGATGCPLPDDSAHGNSRTMSHG